LKNLRSSEVLPAMSIEFVTATRTNRRLYLALPAVLSAVLIAGFPSYALAQAPAAVTAPAAGRQIGTVKAISGTSMTLATDAGQPVMVTLSDAVRVVQLAPGSTDLKAATPITLTDIAVGDRVLVTGKAGETAGQLTASRVILMKSTDIAQKHAGEQADWQKRGSGGLVSSVDASTGTFAVVEGAKKVQVKTTGTTIFRRYSGDSIKFEDAMPGTIAQVQVGDQLRVRGSKSEDGMTVQAEEIVSGSFKNLAGTIVTINAADGTISLKDLATRKTFIIKVTANSDLRRLPERAAAMFAARAKGQTAGAAGAPTAGPGGAAPAGGPLTRTAGGGPGGPGGPGGGGPGADGPGAGGRSAGMDLSQMLSRLPNETIADLKVGEAIMIVASQASPTSSTVTAVTLLSGVEPILAATPTGAPMTLSPWSVGGGAPDSGAAQ
jgi:co-chaperonin GroES (HSP10)